MKKGTAENKEALDLKLESITKDLGKVEDKVLIKRLCDVLIDFRAYTDSVVNKINEINNKSNDVTVNDEVRHDH